MSRLVPSLVLLLLCSTAHAATYYVAPGGKAGNLGTLERPMRTLTAAVARVKAGDEIVVRGGLYRETVTIWQKSGRETAPIRLRVQAGEQAILDGTGSSSNGVIVIGHSSHVRVEGFEIRNGRNAGIYIYDSHHVEVRENTVHDCGGHGINANSSGDAKAGTTHDIVIANNVVYRCVLANRAKTAKSSWMQAVSAIRANRVEISGNYVYENYGEGIDYILSDNGTIRGNRVRDNYSINLYLDNAQSTTVDGNLVWCSADTAFHRNGEPPAGIAAANEKYKQQNPLNHLTISNNIVLRCHSGFSYSESEYGGGLHNTVITNNVFYATDYASIWVRGRSNTHDTTVVANNVFYQKYGRPYASVPTRGLLFRNNAWFGGGDPETIKRGEGDVREDPLLVNAGGGDAADYRLQAGSPLMDAGSTDGAVARDFFGTRRAGRGKGRDIGVHEY
ncbi:MAG TPA: right-handed parallel beta-helix repeat-containing protein [Thermoanaerobaculia bacterium]|nr:right-handed parallel beta-helix repeat-containing protein [Thermoanaerobaculia bacterium]